MNYNTSDKVSTWSATSKDNPYTFGKVVLCAILAHARYVLKAWREATRLLYSDIPSHTCTAFTDTMIAIWHQQFCCQL